MADGITVHAHGGLREVRLDRPAARNALNTAMAAELAAVTARLAEDPAARAVVLTAAGGVAFCVGADLKERAGFGEAELMAQRPVFRAAFRGVLALPQPVIAAVSGYALGGGCELALSADVIVADETAVFGLPEVRVGLIPGGGGTQLLLRRVGPARAADLIFSARQVGVAEAERLGLVDRRVPAAARGAALAWAEQIAAHSPVGLRNAKRALRGGWGLGLDAALDVEDRAWQDTARSPDRVEGIAAFNAKRAPRWPSEERPGST